MKAFTDDFVLTTADNPFNPITQNDEWLNYDLLHGYNTYALIDRIAQFDESMSEDEKDAKEQAAIDFIIRFDPLDLYRRVNKDSDIKAMNAEYTKRAQSEKDPPSKEND